MMETIVAGENKTGEQGEDTKGNPPSVLDTINTDTDSDFDGWFVDDTASVPPPAVVTPDEPSSPSMPVTPVDAPEPIAATAITPEAISKAISSAPTLIRDTPELPDVAVVLPPQVPASTPPATTQAEMAAAARALASAETVIRFDDDPLLPVAPIPPTPIEPSQPVPPPLPPDFLPAPPTPVEPLNRLHAQSIPDLTDEDKTEEANAPARPSEPALEAIPPDSQAPPHVPPVIFEDDDESDKTMGVYIFGGIATVLVLLLLFIGIGVGSFFAGAVLFKTPSTVTTDVPILTPPLKVEAPPAPSLAPDPPTPPDHAGADPVAKSTDEPGSEELSNAQIDAKQDNSEPSETSGQASTAAQKPAPTKATPAPQKPAPAAIQPKPKPKPKPVEQSSNTKLITNPPAVRVQIDGVGIGRTPMKLEIPPGTHTLILTDGKAQGSFEVTGGSTAPKMCFKVAGRKIRLEGCK